ncbi:hypothetical protein [Actinomadura sp. 9N407]|uniref:hypothetical protein n=1 Tax=Actinomadura sp. 9N407 TaxID=3375154 RepID=UPI0037A6CB58
MSGDQGSREDHPSDPADWAPIDPGSEGRPAGPPPGDPQPTGPSSAGPPAQDDPSAQDDRPAGAHPAGGQETRPAFLPPADRYAEPQYPAAWPPPERAPAAQGNVWNIAVILSAVLLLISAFLPWAEARISVDIFGRRIVRELGTVVGIEADGVVVAIPVLALVAVGMAFWGLIGRDDRISALGAVPGVLSLVVCGLFVLRLGDLKERLAADDLAVGYQVAVVTGWYLAVAMSLLVIGFSLARPLSARLGAARADRATPRPEQAAHTQQPPQEAQQQWPEQGQWPQQQAQGQGQQQEAAQWPLWPEQGPPQGPEQPGR